MRTMRIKDVIEKRRSIRKFKDKRVSYDDLKDLVKAARLAPSAANKQPIEYVIVDDPKLEKEMFAYVHWAGYLDWDPSEDERPRAYIVILVDKEKQTASYKYDVGAAAENICLMAVTKGLGTCLLGAIEKQEIRSLLNVPEEKRIDLVIAVGSPDQKAIIEEAKEGDIEYWRDEHGDFHVPKRKLGTILYHNKFE